MKNIHADFDSIIQREEREVQNGHKSAVFWFTGLSGSGKTTIAQAVERALFEKGIQVKVIDGDNTRTGLNKDLGFSQEDRNENIRRVAELSKLLMDTGIVCLNSFVSPTEKSREIARNIIGSQQFYEIYVDTPLEVCEARDVKGLYKKARKGLIKDFTGIDSVYEPPSDPALIVHTEGNKISQSASQVTAHILPIIKNR